jgi:hypothetical protein
MVSLFRRRDDGPGLATTMPAARHNQDDPSKKPRISSGKVAMNFAQLYLARMLQPTVPAGFLAPPTSACCQRST